MEIKTLKEFQSEVAKKHSLGSSLVTGHRVEYFNEASKAYASQAVRLALETVCDKGEGYYYDESGDEISASIDKSSILSLANSIIGKLK